MRRVSRTNSRKHKSRDTVADYCERFQLDEPLYYLGVRLTRRGPIQDRVGTVDEGIPGHLDKNLELNHIWSMRMRPDYRSNFCRMLKEGHDWFGANLSAGRMVCVLTKLVKQEELGEPEEFDMQELFNVFGRWVSGLVIDYAFRDPLLARLNDECLERLHRLQTSGEVR